MVCVCIYQHNAEMSTGSSKGTPGDAKYVTEILWGRRLGRKDFTICFKGIKRIRLIKQSNKCVMFMSECWKTRLQASLIPKFSRERYPQTPVNKEAEGRGRKKGEGVVASWPSVEGGRPWM